ncbi:MAG: hypothetical protein ACOY3P_15215 [Planctomycetota bacterium]
MRSSVLQSVFAVLPPIVVFAAVATGGARAGGGEASGQRMHDPSFESLSAGRLASTGAGATWEVQRTGREAIGERLGVACVEDAEQARSGSKSLLLSLPQDTVGFEFVTVGQRLQLEAGREYEASVWVRWADGPDDPPPRASATSAHRSAIVSFWARDRDGKGTFAGRDEWLFDNRWHKLAFRFCATDPEHRTLVYVSLLPNQKPAATNVVLDDFELTAVEAVAETEPRSGNIVEDSGFDRQPTGGIEPPWNFRNMGGTSIAGGGAGADPERYIAFKMPRETTNFESAQLCQHLALRRGVRYEISCRLRWDNFAPGAPAPIVNYGIFHEDSRTWYGPVDQVLVKNGEWNTYRFPHIPPADGRWKLYVQLNGWGNFGNAVAISADDLTCTVARSEGSEP